MIDELQLVYTSASNLPKCSEKLYFFLLRGGDTEGEHQLLIRHSLGEDNANFKERSQRQIERR